jgi:hypothetical protein
MVTYHQDYLGLEGRDIDATATSLSTDNNKSTRSLVEASPSASIVNNDERQKRARLSISPTH